MRSVKHGISRLQAVVVVVVIVVAAGVGSYALLSPPSGEKHLSITEIDPVNQIDSFVPQNFTVKQGAQVSFVVFNGDDENRTLTITAFNFTMIIPPGQTTRSSFTPDRVGTFTIYSPQTLPSAASQGKPGSPCTGYLTVTS